jgi:Ras GTPase-activating-like protein IQGAP2/3
MSSYQPSNVAVAASIASRNGLTNHVSTKSQRYSLSAIWSMAAENDVEIEDSLFNSQKLLRQLKTKISIQSKRNFLLEKDVRYLDGRIALLIHNKMGASEVL